MRIKYKASLAMFLFSSFFIVSVAIVYNYYYKKITLKNAHYNTQRFADEVALHIDSEIKERGKIATTLANAPLILQALTDSNDQFGNLSIERRKEKITLLNKKWKEIPDPNDPFIQRYLTNPVANYLKHQQGLFPNEYGEIFLTNRYGAIIATTGKLTTFAHAHKYWWLSCYAEGKGKIFFDDRGFDTSVGGYVLGVVVPIVKYGQIIGIMKCNVNIMGPLSHIVVDLTSGKPGITKLVRSKGMIIIEHDKEPLSASVPEVLSQKLRTRQAGTITHKEHGIRVLTAYAPVPITMGSRHYSFGGKFESIDHIKGNIGEGWHVVITRDVEEILQTISNTIFFILFSGGGFVFFAALLSWIFGTRISEPIVQFAKIAKNIGTGMLGQKIEVTSNDEVKDLALSFNSMSSNLKRSQDTLLEREKENRRLLKTIPVGWAYHKIVTNNNNEPIDYIYLEVNDAFCEMTHLKRENVLGKKISEILPDIKDDSIDWIGLFGDVALTGKEIKFENYSEAIGKWFMVTASSPDKGYFVVVFSDITERIQAEEALSESHSVLEQRVEKRTVELQKLHRQLLHSEKLAAIGGLSASIAHEFNNPLQGVLGIISGVARRATLSKEDTKLIAEAIGECKRMRDLVNSLQDFNRPTTGRISSMDIHATIENLLLLSKKEYNTKGITIETNLTKDMPQIKAVADQIKQVLLNLLNNAAYACDRGGTITIETEVLEENVYVRIHDTGAGIKQEYINRIFEPFFTTKPDIKGTGLGLSVSYGIIQKHRGEIVVNSELGKGSTFSIILPIERESNVEKENPAS